MKNENFKASQKLKKALGVSDQFEENSENAKMRELNKILQSRNFQ